MRFAVLCHPGVSVAFLGALAELGLDPVCVVTKDPTFGPGARGVLRRAGERVLGRAVGHRFGPNTWQMARQRGWEVVPSQLGADPLAAALTARQLDVLAVFGFRLLPPQVLGAAREGALGFHPSLLPAHRGATPLFWTVLGGETDAGYSLLRLDAGMDTGPVLEQGRVPLAADDDAATGLAHVCQFGARAFARLLLRRSLGAAWPAPMTLGSTRPADPRAHTSVVELQRDMPLAEVVRRIRAARVLGGAPLTMDGRALRVIDWLEADGVAHPTRASNVVMLRVQGGASIALVCRTAPRAASAQIV